MATKPIVERYTLYGGEVELEFLPKKHIYKIDGDRKIGVTTVTGVINKEALMIWPRDEMWAELRRVFVENPRKLGAKSVTGSTEWMEKTLEKASEAYRYKQLRGTDAGTVGHNWLELFLRAVKDGTKLPDRLPKNDLKKLFGDKPDKDSDEYIRATDHNNMVASIEQFVDWFNENDVEVVDIERIVYSREYDYCGKFDALLRINGKLIMVDFKTSNPSSEFQDGIYPENFAQTGGYDIAYTEEFPDMVIDGHGILNLSKKTEKFSMKILEGEVERQKNRDFFLATLLVKRGMQDRTRLLSSKYRENAKKTTKQKGAKAAS